MKHGLLIGSLALLPFVAADARQTPRAPKFSATGHINKPERREFSEALLKQLKVPSGFQVTVFASKLGHPRMMAAAKDGTVYVTRQEASDVVAVRAGPGGSAAAHRIVASNLHQVHGIALHDDKLYLASPTTVWAAAIKADGSLGIPNAILTGLPDGGQHRARTVGIGPDRMLYISVGSSCNDCAEANRDHATLQRAGLDGSRRSTFARGLRHTIGFGWHPRTGALWGMDNGSDWKGDDVPPEELNQIKEGADYGWPICYGKRVADHATVAEPEDVAKQPMTKEAYCASTEPAILEYRAHSAPIGMTFYAASHFPPDYRDDAFVVFRGSWNRQAPGGYSVARVRFKEGQPVGFDDFLSGFLLDGGDAHFARLAGIVVATDGALLVSDDANGVIYRVAYAARR